MARIVDKLHAAIDRQGGEIGYETAQLIAERYGARPRDVIAIAVPKRLWNGKSKMSREEALANYVDEEPMSPTARGVTFVIGLVVVVGLFLAVKSCFFTAEPPVPSTGTTPRYQACEADLKPRLQACLSGSEDTWEACGNAYMSRMRECTRG
jgi:hypothetical protein